MLSQLPTHIIKYSFYLLFFLVPLIFTPFNYELFEFNKMMLTYALAAVILSAWLIKSIYERKITIQRTPFDIPILLYIVSRLVSTILSLDRHISIWGFYSRFHEGLLATFSYVILYYAFVTHFLNPKDTKPSKKSATYPSHQSYPSYPSYLIRLLRVALTSGIIVSLYGILQHFGIDQQYWIQDVQARVFSTLGQPNWLAAYLSILILISLGLYLSQKKTEVPKSPLSSRSPLISQYLNILISNLYLLSIVLFYLALLWTRSKSGFLGLWSGLFVFYLISFLSSRSRTRPGPKPYQSSPTLPITPISQLLNYLITLIIFLLITAFIGIPFPRFDQFTIPNLVKKIMVRRQSATSLPDKTTQNPPATSTIPELPQEKPQVGSLIEIGGSDSQKIRNIVWQGAFKVFLRYPLFGSGVETFALSYYRDRLPAHNLVSEWDFLYNKAHNEYLNLLATTGLFGILSYLFLIAAYARWFARNLSSLRNLSNPKSSNISISQYLNIYILLGLFSAYISILVSNFFGFSVVPVALFFFLIPAFSLTLVPATTPLTIQLPFLSRQSRHKLPNQPKQLTLRQILPIVLILGLLVYWFTGLLKMWLADVYFSRGRQYSQAKSFVRAYKQMQKALNLNPFEPFFYDEFSNVAAQLALEAQQQAFADKSLINKIVREAVAASNLAIKGSPNNPGYYKTRTKVFYALSNFDERYRAEALAALEKAHHLSPTDAKISYNLGLIYAQLKQTDQALKMMEYTTQIKSNYHEAFFALGLFYKDMSETVSERKQKQLYLQKARAQMEYILEKIAPTDERARKNLEEWK